MNEITSQKYLSRSEVSELEKSLSHSPLKTRLVIRFLLETGCRGCEVRDLKVGDFDLKERVVVIRGKKHGKTRQIPLSEALVGEISEFIHGEKISQDKPIFELSRSGLKYLWYQARPVKKGVHALRHSFAVYLYEKTRDIRLVQYCMGHRSINSTLVYADLVDSRGKLEKALQGGLYD